MTPAIYSLDPNGALEPVDPPSGLPPEASLNAVSRHLPGGVYTTFRTYQSSRALALEDHLARLEESALLLGRPLQVDRAQVRGGLREAVRRFNDGDVRLRLMVDLEDQPGRIFILLEPLVSPSLDDYDRGVSTVTCRQQRDNPQAKQTAFISVAESIRKELPPGVHEGLIVNPQGVILEGLSSNFFAVINGRLHTAGEAVLSGITRQVVLEAAANRGMKVSLEGINVTDIPRLDEAFITSSTRGVLPVRRIDNRTVGLGMVGPVTISLGSEVRRLIHRRLEEI
jgi:branched-chain amino acid aminotransferase